MIPGYREYMDRLKKKHGIKVYSADMSKPKVAREVVKMIKKGQKEEKEK